MWHLSYWLYNECLMIFVRKHSLSDTICIKVNRKVQPVNSILNKPLSKFSFFQLKSPKPRQIFEKVMYVCTFHNATPHSSCLVHAHRRTPCFKQQAGLPEPHWLVFDAHLLPLLSSLSLWLLELRLDCFSTTYVALLQQPAKKSHRIQMHRLTNMPTTLAAYSFRAKTRVILASHTKTLPQMQISPYTMSKHF